MSKKKGFNYGFEFQTISNLIASYHSLSPVRLVYKEQAFSHTYCCVLTIDEGSQIHNDIRFAIFTEQHTFHALHQHSLVMRIEV